MSVSRLYGLVTQFGTDTQVHTIAVHSLVCIQVHPRRMAGHGIVTYLSWSVTIPCPLAGLARYTKTQVYRVANVTMNEYIRGRARRCPVPWFL